MRGSPEVLIAACGPSVDNAVVVHDTTDVGAGAALAVVTRVAGCAVEVVVHAGVVADFMGHNLEWILKRII